MGLRKRRRFLIAAGALLAVRLGHAQRPAQVRRIGILVLASPSAQQGFRKMLLDSLRRLGYDEGRNLEIDWRFGENIPSKLPALADDLVRLKPDLIVTTSNDATVEAMRATRTIPIVMSSGMPVESGLIASYARPGGNVTGLDWWPSPNLADKEYEILKLVVPGAKRAVRIWNPTIKLAHLYGDEHVRLIASKLGLTLLAAEMTHADDLARVLERTAALKPDVLYVSGDQPIRPRFAEIAAFALARKLPSIGWLGYAGAGGLLQRHPHLQSMIDRLASYIDRVLRGAKPAELPVEQPTRYELVLNMKTANAMGLKLSPAFLAQVDRTIE